MTSHDDGHSHHEPPADHLDAHGAPHDGHPPGNDRSGLIVAAAWVLLIGGSAAILSRTGLENFDMVVPFLILLMPLLGFVVLSLFGDAIRDHGEGQGASVLACMTVLTSFALAAFSVNRLTTLIASKEGLRFTQPYLGFNWIEAGGFQVQANLLLDNLSAVMILVVTGIGSLIHIYSVGYMAHDPERVRFFSYLNLFTFFMLLLVLGGSLPLLFVGWEGVGLCSYLLIGFWFKKKSASDAGKKAFVMNRIGDVGLILGMVLMFHAFGTLDLVDIATNAGSLAKEPLWTFGPITAVCLLLFVGACGKSAQIPLHVWLPDAMEGPTPVSALIHAATMVTAGVYMVARLAPLFSQSETAMTIIAVVGTATAVLGATIALVQSDIKKVLAYSTISQLGYMFLAAGVGAFGVAVFHLFTHAFFKALLFLGSGSVIHALGGEQDMTRMGGLKRRIPWTFWTFLIGTLAIAGIPPLAGYHSKDAILAGALAGHWTVLFAIGLLVAVLTAFYMGRLLFLTFFGEYRGDAAVEAKIHESPWSMVLPLVALAVGSLVAGFVKIDHIVQPVLRLEAEHHPHARWLPFVATAGGVFGLAAAFYLFVMYTDLAARLATSFRRPARVLQAKYGFDTLYDRIAERGFVGGSEKILWRGVDVGLIDAMVNGSGGAVDHASRSVRLVQSGLVRGYALLILGGAVALFAYLLWL
jgi:NADH-quinone oxidoreductase subunit L